MILMADLPLDDTLRQLFETIRSRRGAAADESYTASLLAGGPEKCAKKFGEEAIETVIAGVAADKNGLRHEAADTLYHLLVLLASADVTLDEVAATLKAREGTSGHDEKASRGG